MASTDFDFLIHCARRSIPRKPEESVCEWGREHVRLIGSARSEHYDPDITPWCKAPVECTGDGSTRSVSFVKPIQAGGSAAGEVAICRRIALRIGGDIQWNWESNDKARDRWDKRLERILKACGPVDALWPKEFERFKAMKCLVAFGHCNLIVQGQHVSENLDSDSIAFQVNEELHNWEPGHLAKADGRLTAVWNGFQMNISNASFHGDQFHQKFSAGTMEFWEVPCPVCGEYWTMRAHFNPKQPNLGGLVYDSTGCKLSSGEYDYNKLEKTIRYRFPCGHEIPDDREIRRRLSKLGRYGKPTNLGAKSIHRSFTLEAVAVDYIPWLTLIQEKHTALRAMRLGDPEPWWRYLRERECKFVDTSEDRPVIGSITINPQIKKNRDGLANRVARFAALDRQQGSLSRKNELPHWWGLIRDVDEHGNSLLVWEGKLLTDDDAARLMADHGVKPFHVVVDSGFDWTHVTRFCLRHGFNAIKGSGNQDFAHKDGTRRIFSPEEELWRKVGANGPTRENANDEPLFWHYSKAGIRERLHWLRASKELKWEVPGDVSDDYKSHLESEELRERKHPRTGEVIREFVQIKRRNDLFVLECYCAMLMEMAGLLGRCEPTEAQAKIYELKENHYEPKK